MNLIDTSTLQLKHVPEAQKTPYAILSHTWGDDEVTYQDFSNIEKAKSKLSYTKILKTCQIAASRGLPYVWIDTCCIDKSSSAELTEAINSMFRWYREANICFAYISDLPPREGGPAFDWLNDSHYRWLTRGWTLQELVAAAKIEFYDAEWEYRGDKATLLRQLHLTTGIDEQVLANSNILPEIPVARKMSWAASRHTTRIEDMAYCLLGLFDISMPMIYGEGERAFIRLQEEIAKGSNDMSLFAWTSTGENESDKFTGMFASSPAKFAGCGKIVRWADFLAPAPEFAITNRGVRLETRVGLTENWKTVLDLGCCGDAVRGERLGIYLYQTGFGFVRQHPERLYYTQDASRWSGQKSTIYVQKRLRQEEKRRIHLELASRVYIRFPSDETGDYSVLHETVICPEALWNRHGEYFLTMESVTSRGETPNTIYPRFIGIYGFEIHAQPSGRITSCLLVCGIFEDTQGNDRPCAVVYHDKDPNTNFVWHANNGEANGALLGVIRDSLILEHSPDGKKLCWNDLANRVVRTDAAETTLSIHLEICLAEGNQLDIDRGDVSGGVNVASLPPDYSGERQYVVLVHISRDPELVGHS